MPKTIKSGLAMVQVLESWGIDHIYGIPGGSINSTMHALFAMQQAVRYIQVRHEETGALAASAAAKMPGKIGARFGSAGPGATHLYNGLYDAQMDKVPVLALVGQVASTAMNYNAFQEQNEDPLFADVAVYNRLVTSPASLPHVVDEAIRQAYKYNGVAAVTIPVDFGWFDIPDIPVSAAENYRTAAVMPAKKDVEAGIRLLEQAKRPVLYIGQGTRGAGEEVIALSEHYSMPIVTSVLAKGIIPDATENLMGTAARVASKPGNEALQMADLIVFIGSDFPFARIFFPQETKMLQVDNDQLKLGRRHHAEVAILGDAKETMRQLCQGTKKPVDAWLEANRKNRRSWQDYLASLATSDAHPLKAEAAFTEINRIAEDDAIFIVDVGNTTIHSIRLLDMNMGRQRITTSGLFATMGYGVPGGIAAKLNYPQRQVFNLTGDGAFSMCMHDITTQVKYKLPVINVVFSNDSLNFIEAEQEDTKQPKYGVDLYEVDFAKAGEAMGALGIQVTKKDQLAPAFDEAAKADRPVVIDIKIENARPFPAEAFVLDPNDHSQEEIDAFKQRYHVGDMPTLRQLLEK